MTRTARSSSTTRIIFMPVAPAATLFGGFLDHRAGFGLEKKIESVRKVPIFGDLASRTAGGRRRAGGRQNDGRYLARPGGRAFDDHLVEPFPHIGAVEPMHPRPQHP